MCYIRYNSIVVMNHNLEYFSRRNLWFVHSFFTFLSLFFDTIAIAAAAASAASCSIMVIGFFSLTTTLLWLNA